MIIACGMFSLVQRYSRSRGALADIVTCNAIEVCQDLLSESQGEQSIGVSGRCDAVAMDVSYNIHEAVSRPSAYPLADITCCFWCGLKDQRSIQLQPLKPLPRDTNVITAASAVRM
ncbi:hypothetical protein GFGA_1c1127 [Gluconobacter frateurii NBRC 103465]|nr:hypothetical protein GFGA_1c1127 [Gluconobacter frateurii NBRC 103465]